MKSISGASKVNWPTNTVQENFQFDAIDADGVFKFLFKWMNGRWNCWVTLPNGETRGAGVYPNVTSWSGFLDYGLLFKTDLAEINFQNLLMTEIYILKW